MSDNASGRVGLSGDGANSSRPRVVADFAAVSRWLQKAQDDSLEAVETATGLVGDADMKSALDDLQDASDEAGPGVFHSPTNQIASLLQSAFERLAVAANLEIPFDGQDVRTVLSEVRSQATTKHPIMRPSSDDVENLPNDASIFVVGDWGTGLYGAPVTAQTLKASNKRHDLLLHLGDVYYSGQPDEVQQRFLDIWPSSAGAVSRTLNGNHDMYSGGFGYFDLALPHFGQTSSYFAFQNDSWLLLALDTAWLDNDLDSDQVSWVERMVERAGSRKIVLFSHHPRFSSYKDPLSKKLDDLLESHKIFAWYWGHEHHCVIYDRHPQYRLHARCVGNGGMPHKRKDLADFPVVNEVGTLKWRKLSDDNTPDGLILDGPNEFIEGEEHKFGPHGYMLLRLNGTQLIEEVHSPNGDLLYSGALE